jgi:hypothetical protein
MMAGGTTRERGGRAAIALRRPVKRFVIGDLSLVIYHLSVLFFSVFSVLSVVLLHRQFRALTLPARRPKREHLRFL